MKKLLGHIKESIERDKAYRKKQAFKARENYLWDKAGRPTGPNCDQSWRDEL